MVRTIESLFFIDLQNNARSANSRRCLVCVPRAGFEPATYPLAKGEALSIELPWEQKQIYVFLVMQNPLRVESVNVDHL